MGHPDPAGALSDAAQRRGIRIDVARLEKELRVPVVETVAVRRGGAAALVAQIEKELPPVPAALPEDDDLHVSEGSQVQRREDRRGA